jgi:hypothetical protein
MQRDVNTVRDLSARLVALNAEHETFVGTHESEIFRGWLQMQETPSAPSLERMTVSLQELDRARHWVMLPFFFASIAEMVGELGNRPQAATLLNRATQLIDLTGEEWASAEVLRLEARFMAKNREEATTLLRASLAKATQQAAKLWELRAASDLATILLAEGKHTLGRDTLAPICAWFTEGLDTPDFVGARAVLAGCN